MSNSHELPYEVEGEVIVHLTDMDDDTLSMSFTRSTREDKPEDTVELRIYQYDGIGTVYFVAGADIQDFVAILQQAIGELDGTRQSASN